MNWSKKGVSQESMEKRAEKKDTGYGSRGKGYIKDGILNGFVPEEGENCVRIIEPIEVDGLGYYGFDVHFHRNVSYGKDMYLCLARMREVIKRAYDKSIPSGCFIDDQQTSELWEEDPELAKTYFPDHRVLMQILDLNGKDPSEVLLWSCPITLSEEIIGQSKRKGSNTYRDVSSPKEGIAVYFDRIGKGRGTKYKSVQMGDEVIPLPAHVKEDRVKFIDLLIIPTYDEVKAAFLNIGADDVGSYDEPEKEREEEEEPEVIEDDLTGIDRAELKKLLKDVNKEFVVYKTTTDDDIRNELRRLQEPETEEEEPDAPEPDKPDAEETSDKPSDIKARLKAAIDKRKAQK